MPWINLKMTGLELETTSPDPGNARIVTAWVGVQTADAWHPKNWLQRQDQPIPAEATAIHGITT